MTTKRYAKCVDANGFSFYTTGKLYEVDEAGGLRTDDGGWINIYDPEVDEWASSATWAWIDAPEAAPAPAPAPAPTKPFNPTPQVGLEPPSPAMIQIGDDDRGWQWLTLEQAAELRDNLTKALRKARKA